MIAAGEAGVLVVRLYFSVNVNEIRLGPKNLLDDLEHWIVIRNLAFSRDSIPNGPLPDDEDAPLAIVPICAVLGVAADAEEIRIVSSFGAQIPTPVLLAGLGGVNVFLGQLGSKPSRKVFAKAARVDEVLLSLREVETASREQKIPCVHCGTFSGECAGNRRGERRLFVGEDGAEVEDQAALGDACDDGSGSARRLAQALFEQRGGMNAARERQ